MEEGACKEEKAREGEKKGEGVKRKGRRKRQGKEEEAREGGKSKGRKQRSRSQKRSFAHKLCIACNCHGPILLGLSSIPTQRKQLCWKFPDCYLTLPDKSHQQAFPLYFLSHGNLLVSCCHSLSLANCWPAQCSDHCVPSCFCHLNCKQCQDLTHSSSRELPMQNGKAAGRSVGESV